MRGVLLSLAALVITSAAGAAEIPVKSGHGVTLADALHYPKDFQHLDYVNPHAPKGGAMRDYATGGFDSFNPFSLKGAVPKEIGLLFDSLMTTPEDEPMAQYGLIAESVEYPVDYSSVTYTLRQNARFHDGTPITADDVIFTIEALKERGSPSLRFTYKDVAKAEKIAPNKVRFTFSAEPKTRDLLLLTGRLPVLSKAYWNDKIESETLIPPLGSGPYSIADFEPGRFIVYRRVADYWAKDLPIRRGQNNFDYIRFEYFRDNGVAFEAFKTGAYDFRIETESKTWVTGYNFDAVKSGQVVKEEVTTREPMGMQGFAFNLRKAKFADLRVRRAIALAFDFEWANRHLFYGKYKRNDSFFANSELAAEGKPSADELALLVPWRDELPPEVFGEAAYKAPTTEGNGDGKLRENLAKAAELLREAGFKVEKGKLIDPKTRKPFTIEFMLTASEFERVILPFMANLKRLGIGGRIRTVDTSQYVERVRRFDFDMVVATFPQSLAPSQEQRNYWSSAAADKTGSGNIIGIKSKAVDALVEKIVAAPDRKSLIAATRALDRVLSWNAYVVPQWYLDKYWLAYWNRFGIPKTRPEYGIGRIAWWHDASKDAQMHRDEGSK
jgi:microcin C transport system substrate-binding protein